MNGKAWGMGLTVILVAATAAMARPKNQVPLMLDARYSSKEATKIIMPGQELRYDGAITPEMADYNIGDQVPSRDPIGETMVVGSTFYDYQHNGSISKMIAVDREGDVHFTWMKGYDAGNNSRHVVYNAFLDGALIYAPAEAVQVDNGSRSGYCHLTLLPEDHRAMIFYHVIGPPDHADDYTGTSQAFDFDRGLGAFGSTYPNPWPNTQIIWPHGSISMNNISHVLGVENGDYPPGNDQIWQRVAYWRGEPNRGFDDWGWIDPPVELGVAGTISAVAASSETSNRTVLAYLHNRVGRDLGAWSEAPGWWQKNNDIRYVVSQDGRNFDFQRGIKSMTKIIPPRPELAEFNMQEAYGDTFRPYDDIDIRFDPWDDSLYAAFSAAGFWEEPNEDPAADGDPEPADGATAEHCILWFWNGVEDTITMVYNGYYFNRTDNGGGWHSRCGAWRMNADRPSIAFDPENEGHIYLVWVSFPQISVLNEAQDGFDYLDNGMAQDTSVAGYKNAEVMVSFSDDYGITWHDPVNVTETIWEGEEAPAAGEMSSEAYVSVATNVVDGALHIFYIQDTEAGGLPQNEGTPTNSPAVYHIVPLEDLPETDPVELPVEGFTFHNQLDNIPQIRDVVRNPATPTPANQVPVTAQIVGGGDRQIVDALLIYRINGENEQEIDMALIDDDLYYATIPAQEEGVTVWYRIRAVNDAGAPATFPYDNSWHGYVVREEGELLIRDIQMRPDDWANDYSLYKGYEVTVEGIVTTDAAFAENYGGYVIQEEVAAWSGVVIRGVEQDLVLDHRVRVTGTVFERDPEEPLKWQFATYIDVTSVEDLGAANRIDAMELDNVGSLLYSGGAEAIEACVVLLRSVQVGSLSGGPSANQRTYWPITQPEEGEATGYLTIIGLNEDQVNQMEIREFAHGTEIAEITGILTENNGYYAITLRNSDDLGAVAVKENTPPSPYKFVLNPAFPNPFNALTTVSFSLPQTAFAVVSVYDLSGREVARIAEGQFKAGEHAFTVDASELSTGVYMLRLESGKQSASQKIVLLK